MKVLSIQIGRVLQEQGTTQSELARRLNISRQRVSQMVNGEVSEIRLETLAAICRVLNCEPGDILKMVEEDEPA